ncbi:uncharacterized protein LOC120108118 [Phoenix dactylifera]|uniref:Uncharacterized protein LOC120108118 n=1 Tax=Phoenix dactylifera TaxID=42345 RepID=A0A8B8ZTK4_PHODC|nr:uncharacterized protein LOC120108118 [Phoenix dactylifera]
MRNREEEVSANIAARRRGARGRGLARQLAEQTPNPAATQADFAGASQMMTQLLQMQQEMQQQMQQQIQQQMQMQQQVQQQIQMQMQQQVQTTARPAQSIESYYERFHRLNPPMFDGGADPLVAETWIREVEKMFKALQYPKEVKVRSAIPMLKGNAEFWWTAIEAALEGEDELPTWEEFKKMFYDQYFPESVRISKENEFLSLRQTDDMTVLEYANKFTELGRFCPQMIEIERSKANRFEQGLRDEIRPRLLVLIFTSYGEALERALKVEADLKKSGKERGEQKRPETSRNLMNRPRNFEGPPNKKKKFKACYYCDKMHSGPCLKRMGACFICGQPGHIARDCPNKKKVESEPSRPTDQMQRGAAWVYALTRQDASTSDRVVAGMIPINSVDASVLFDSGATHSFISSKFSASLHLMPDKLDEPLLVATPLKKTVVVDSVHKNCIIQIEDRKLWLT